MKNSLHKILYIEDDHATRLLVKKILDHPPFQYFEATNGMEGLKKSIEIKPDLIIMDIYLPDISGTELTTKIKSIPELREIVIVAITGMGSPEAREISLIAGCDGYINKPIKTKLFPEQILKFLKGKREEVSEDRRDLARKRYEETLVDHLTGKVEELQLSNELLTERTNLLKNYSSKLEMMLSIINNLQICQTLTQLEHNLVNEIKTLLRYERCIFFEPDSDNNLLKATVTCGSKKNEFKDLSLRSDSSFLQKIFEKKHIHLATTKSALNKQPFSDIRQRLKTDRFIFGILGNPQKDDRESLNKQEIDDLLSKALADIDEYPVTDREIIRDHFKEFLFSEVFTIGGYLFIDNKDSGKAIPSYDIGILEMLLQTASLIYQNLQLREQLKQLFIRAEKDAVTDYLTNLFNYRYFKQHLGREFDRAQRHNSKFVSLMIDIDHFKSYNDAFGHQAGDWVLKSIAEVFKKNTRSSDIVARYGGEEFVIVCPELDKNMGIMLAEKLRNIIAQSFVTDGKKIPGEKITISVGVAAYPDDADSPDELIRNADKALYKAKENGRNQVQVYSSN
jgi:diguanylate cyclase (GGDEF)-like protein